METLEELKAIIAGKPEGATIVDIEVGGFIDYLYVDESADGGQKIKSCANGGDGAIEYSDGNIRSLSDIERIIELEEKLKSFADDISDCNCIGGVSKTLREYGL